MSGANTPIRILTAATLTVSCTAPTVISTSTVIGGTLPPRRLCRSHGGRCRRQEHSPGWQPESSVPPRRIHVFNVVIINDRNTNVIYRSPTDLTIVNSQYLADGSLDPARLTPRNAGFGAATGAQPMWHMQSQVRFMFSSPPGTRTRRLRISSPSRRTPSRGESKSILAKLDANDRTHAAIIGLKRGIIELSSV